MDSGGELVPVSDPILVFLTEKLDVEDREGGVVSLMVEGLRSLGVEVRELVSSAKGDVRGWGGKKMVEGIA